MVLDGFGAHFGGFGEGKWSLKPKKAKYEKPMFYLSKIDVFKVSGHPTRHEHL